MLSRLLLASAMTLSLGGAALAQTQPAAPTGSAAGQTTDGGGNQQGMPTGWDQSMMDAFYSNGTLRSEADVKAGWATLSPERQAMVSQYCSTNGTAAADSAGGTVATGSTTAMTSTGTSAGGSTSGSASNAANAVPQSTELCGYVGSM